jgi:hypothetical protein
VKDDNDWNIAYENGKQSWLCQKRNFEVPTVIGS